ncbi:MAG: aldolase/citrate lyase family protein [Planctomycetota bacterium]
MNIDAVRRLHRTLAQDRPALGLWITLESPSVTEMAVGLGLDWVVIDAEHGHLGWPELVAHVRATVRSETVCLIRVAANDEGLIKRVLDIGADGVVIPWMESVEQLQAAKAAARYPTAGRRGIGAERATAWGRGFMEHIQQEAGEVLVVPLIESVQGGEQAAALAAVPDIPFCIVGPADWSATAGGAGTWEAPGVPQGIAACVQAWRAAGKQAGVVSTGPEDLRARRRQGFRLLGLGLDGALLIGAMERQLLAASRAARLRTSLRPEALGTEDNPLPMVPPYLAAHQPARLVDSGSCRQIPLDDRSLVQHYVGAHCHARSLCTALVHFQPGGSLARYAHPTAANVIVVSGRVSTEVDGRHYELTVGQGITIPAQVPHQTGNASDSEPAVIHVCIPDATISHERCEPAAEIRRMPADATGEPGAEQVERGDDDDQVHAGATMPASGIRTRRLVAAAGCTAAPTIAPVERSLIVITGGVRVRTDQLHQDLTAGTALAIPAGVPLAWTVAADGAEFILSHADSLAEDLAITDSVLCPADTPVAGPREPAASAS